MPHRKPPTVSLKTTVATTCALIALPLATFAHAPSSYSVETQLNSLNVTYYVKKNDVNITLLVFNHEAFAVICDAQYRSGPEQLGKREETIEPGKGATYTFRFGRGSEQATLDLQCVKTVASSTTTTPPPEVKIQDLSTPNAH